MKILLAGDSTVATQPDIEPYDPVKCHCGWGQMLNLFVEDKTQVLNFAANGLTVETFIEKGNYKRLLDNFEKGDYVFFQFGHNDQKRPNLRANGGYREQIIKYIDEIRQKGGIPILVTSVCRNSWRGDNGLYNDLLEPYANSIKDIAKEKDIALLDLHEVSKNWLEKLGVNGAKKYFFPGDYTHPNDFGGFVWAKFVYDLIVENNHKNIINLKNVLLEKEDIPIVPSRNSLKAYSIDNIKDTVCGWTSNPIRKYDLEKFDTEDILSVLDALEIAKTNYGFFVSINVNVSEDEALWYQAFENGYLSNSLKDSLKNLNRPILKDEFKELMLLACSCRNNIFDKERNLDVIANKDNTILSKNARVYALELETMATGAIVTNQKIDTPDGC